MNEIEINEDNCVLSLIELDYITKAIDVFLRTDALNHENFINCKASQIFQKITKLNDLVNELHSRNIKVRDCVKLYEIGKQAKEKQK